MAGTRTGARERIEKARGWLIVGFALAGLAFAIIFFRMQASQGHQLDTQQAQITALSGGLSTAEAQLREHGISPIPKAPSVIVSEVAGPPGPGPSDSQVQSAVNAYLDAHPPTASVDPVALTEAVDAYLVANPPAGSPPPPSEVAADVAAYLQANPPPSGPAGEAGSPGADGQQGPVGPMGPQGNPGSPPAGWTWTDPQGNTYDCVQDSGTPAPHYACTLQSSPSPSASPSAPPTTAGSPMGTASATATSGATTASGGTQSGGVTDAAAQRTHNQPATPTPSPTPSGHHTLLPLIALLRREDLAAFEP